MDWMDRWQFGSKKSYFQAFWKLFWPLRKETTVLKTANVDYEKLENAQEQSAMAIKKKFAYRIRNVIAL